MAPRFLTFYFDYLSPYAYFAWLRVETFCEEHDLGLQVQPTLLAGLLNHWGHLGPAEIPPKRAFVFKDTLRYAAQHGIEIQFPKFHPFNPLTALRVSLREVSGEQQAHVVHALYRASWSEHTDIGNPDVVAGVLDRAGLDGASLVGRTQDPEVKQALKDSTQRAVQAGVFGVPSMCIDGELFWGNDQFGHMERFLIGADPVDADMIDRLAGAVATADRRAKTE